MNLLVNIDVDDLDRATTFYRDALGLTPARRLGESVVELTGGGTPIYLLARQAGTHASEACEAPRTYDRHWTPVHLDFVVEDIDLALCRARDAGAGVEQAVTVHQWGKLALLSDPFGHGFCLVQFLGRGYDEIAR